MKIWSEEEEAANLRKRFQGVNRAAFARDHGIKGGQAMIYQHITGRRPLNLEAATAYAAGFKCALEEISPRLAIEAGKAAALSGDAPVSVPVEPKPWPFPSISEEKIRSLSVARLNQIEGAIALALGQLDIGLEVAGRLPPGAVLPKRGELFATNASDDAFPMRIAGLSDGDTELQQPMVPYPEVRLSRDATVIANVAPAEPQAANDKFEKVPELGNVRLAAGDGIENHLEDQTGVVQFRRSFLRSVGAEPGKARVVYAKGDSMEPVIQDGAALLVVPNESLTLRDLAGGGVYAINYDGKMLVKTIVRDKLTGRWMARSFNPAHSDIPLDADSNVRVLGQVVWAGMRLRDDATGQWIKR